MNAILVCEGAACNTRFFFPLFDFTQPLVFSELVQGKVGAAGMHALILAKRTASLHPDARKRMQNGNLSSVRGIALEVLRRSCFLLRPPLTVRLMTRLLRFLAEETRFMALQVAR